MDQFAQPQKQSGSVWTKFLSYVVYLLAWLILSAAGLWLMLQIRDLAVELMIFVELNPWAVRGFDRWIIFLLGLAWFIAMMWMEHYLRTGLDKKRLWSKIGVLAAIEALLTAVVFGVRFFIR